MKLVVGLGNPGKEYENTRHNTGRIMVGMVEKKLDEMKIKFITPDNFMNNSGKAVTPLVKSKKDLKDLIVIYDDIDLPLGTIRISYNRGTGGHNGVSSIIKHLGTPEFVRVRIGIAQLIDGIQRKPPVLGNFEQKEYEHIITLVPRVQDIIHSLCTFGIEKTMNEYNKKP